MSNRVPREIVILFTLQEISKAILPIISLLLDTNLEPNIQEIFDAQKLNNQRPISLQRR